MSEKKSNLIELKVKKEGKEYVCYLNEPGFDEYAMALAAMTMINGQLSIAKGGKFLIESCWNSGDNEIMNDPKLLFSASLKAAELVDVFEAEIKKN